MKGINLIVPVNGTGYGITGKNIALELNKVANVSLFPIGQISGIDTQKEADSIGKMIQNGQLFDSYADCLRIWHQHDMSQFVGNGAKIGFPIFELDRFSDLELHHLSNLDHIIVCSQWAKEVVVENVDHLRYDDVSVCPLGINPHRLRKTEDDLDHQVTQFFTCGKWEYRKGHDKVIQAFCMAFEEDDNVMLNVMCDNPFLTEEQTNKWKSLYLNSKMGHRVKFISRKQTHGEVLGIMSMMDCGVYLSRAEGWNLELLETMSCGVPVIATNYSGHTEFCNDDNCMLVEVADLEWAKDDKWFDGKTGKWARLDHNQVAAAATYMAEVHREKFVNVGGITTGEHYTWENSAKRILEYV